MSFLRTLTYAAVGFAITVAPLAAEEQSTPQTQALVCYSILNVGVNRFVAFAERNEETYNLAMKLIAARDAWERRMNALGVPAGMVFQYLSVTWGEHQTLVTVDAIKACVNNAPREENL